MSDLIEEHLSWCDDIGFSPLTIGMRRIILWKLHKHLVASGLSNGIEAATAAEIRQWIALPRRDGQPKSRAWRHNMRMHVNAFFTWAVDEAEELDWSPMAKVPKVKLRKLVPKPVGEDDLRFIVEHSIPLWRLVAVLGGWAGLRDCEIARLEPADVGAQTIRILGKGDIIGEVDIHPKVRAELDLYSGDEPYVVQAGGRADARWISRGAGRYYRILTGGEVVGRRVVGGKKITPHMFRHRFITQVLASSGNLRTAQEAARHASITSTVGYSALVNGERRRGILALPDAGSAS